MDKKLDTPSTLQAWRTWPKSLLHTSETWRLAIID